ncbi:MAG: divergent PAP2 family protein [Lachnospiraceae bacterium]|nr:divergent PAP2 family protein [Lachnospiraceae bacterium]
MEVIEQLISNRILWAGVFAWASAQILKTITFAVINKTLDIKRLLGDGGMPSAHSATVTAIAVATGFIAGFDTPVFAVAIMLAFIVMHDAMGVRLETGKQAKIINDMIKLVYTEDMSPEEKLKEFVGHTPSQVIAGFVLGIIVDIVIFVLL